MMILGGILLSLAISAHASLEPCDVVGQLKADPVYCDQFYQCTNKGWEMIVCPFGLYFNPKISVCDWPDDVPCGNNNEDDHNTKLEPCDNVGKLKGDSKQCNNFYQCTEKGWELKSCKSPLLFNSISLTCDWSVYVTCAEDKNHDDHSEESDNNDDDNDASRQSDQDDHTILKPCETIGQMKGESKNCQQYYVCTEEGWVSQECLAPLLFNSISKTLEPCDNVGKLKGDSKQCNNFYQCTEKGWELKSCKSPLLFNSISLTCDWSVYVTCAEDKNHDDHSEESDNNDDDNDASRQSDQDDHTILKPCETIGQMKGESKNCQQYYVCTEEGWVSQECLAPLLFNSISKTCDYSLYVTCAK